MKGLNVKVRCPYCGSMDMKWMDTDQVGILSFHKVDRVRLNENGQAHAMLSTTTAGSLLKGIPVRYMECPDCGSVALFRVKSVE